MATVVDDIKTELGGTTTLSEQQIALWVEDAQRLIDRRAQKLNATVDPLDREYLTRLAVVAHARNPSGAAQLDAAVDDGRVSRRMPQSTGRVAIDDGLWALIGLDEPDLSGGWSGSLPYAGGYR